MEISTQESSSPYRRGRAMTKLFFLPHLLRGVDVPERIIFAALQSESREVELQGLGGLCQVDELK